MNRIKRKTQSQRGASITFALLLFLVCAVISSVVIVAGTTAAGRMSQRAETDQRYYAVSSAVELLIRDFIGKTVVAEYTREVGTELDDGGIKTDITDVSADADALLSKYSRQLVLKRANADPTAANPTVDTENLQLTVGEGSPLNCDIKAMLSQDGQLIFIVANTVPEGETNPRIYTLQAHLKASISESSMNYKKMVGSEKKTMELVKTTLEWSLNGIKKEITLNDAEIDEG